MEYDSRLSVAIVGGGIGGLSLALGLLQHSHLKISVYEAAAEFSEIGAGLAFGPNAQRALSLLSPGAEAAYVSQATSNRSEAFNKTWFEFRSGKKGVKEDSILSKIENSTGQQTAHRAKFLNELAKLIPEGVAHFGKRLDKVQEQGLGKGVILHFKDGTIASADCLIGADGVHSAVRKHLLGAQHPATRPVFTNTVAYRGLVPMDVARERIGSFADDAYMWCNDGGMVMTYPIDFGKTLNVVATQNRIKTWKHATYTVAVDKDAVMKVFEHWGEIPRSIIKMIRTPTMWAMLDHLPAPYYHSSNVAMMGDAAHASTPFQGAGAGQAIEDALVLSSLFARVTATAHVAAAFGAYDAVRRTRSQRVVQTSREAMELYAFDDGFVNGNAEKWKAVWEDRMDWIWSFDLDNQNRVALQIYGERLVGWTPQREAKLQHTEDLVRQVEIKI